LEYLNAPDFGTTLMDEGILTVGWDDEDLTGKTVGDDSSIFEINFMAIGLPGNFSSIRFTNNPTDIEVSVSLESDVFIGDDGAITIVPEPIHIALPLFAGVVLCATTVRRLLQKRRLPDA
jgi:hypothetical protein